MREIPTAATIDALPEPIRWYIHQLETHAVDPAGDIRALWQAREQVEQLTAKLAQFDEGCSECGWNDEHSPQCSRAESEAFPVLGMGIYRERTALGFSVLTVGSLFAGIRGIRSRV